GEKQFVSGTRGGGWGYSKKIPLSQLHYSNKGYLVNDICEIKIEITRKIAANAKKPVKQEGKQSVKGKGKPGYSTFTCIWCCSKELTMIYD
ncbi:hypothetical protein MKW98_005541, partial [Papaver atlanticum]